MARFNLKSAGRFLRFLICFCFLLIQLFFQNVPEKFRIFAIL